MADAAANQALGVGTVLAGTYEVLRLVGKGGMGSVWEARHLRLEGKKVAIKVLHAEVAGDAESVARFRREAQIASRLGHPNIVQVHDFNELADGAQYLVLEYLEGESLAERLARGPVPVDYTMAIVRQVSSALLAAHTEGIVHRDLKPHNIFLCPTETGGYATEQAKVLDFGISKIRGSQTVQTQASAVLGTPQYMAPEQAMGDHAAVDARTDIFALGAIVYEMLSGQVAFSGSTIPAVMFKVVYEEPAQLGELVPGIDPGIAAAVHRALAKQQDQRFADVSAFVEALTGDPLITLRGDQAVAPVSGRPLPPSVSTSRPGARAHSDEAFAHTAAPGQGQAATAATAATAGTAHSVATASTLATPSAGVPAAAAHTAQPVAATPSAAPGPATETAGPATETAGGSRRSLGLVLGLAAVIAAVVVTVWVMKSAAPGTGAQDTDTAASTDTAAAADMAEPGDEAGEPSPEPTADPGDQPDQADQTASATGRKDPDPAGQDQTGEDQTGEDQTGEDQTGEDREARQSKDREPDRPARRARASRSQADEPDRDLSGPVAAKLAEARELLQSGRYDRAIREARSSLGHKRTAAAYAVLTMSYCGKRDLGNARANFSNVKGRRIRARVLRYCARRDIDLSGM